MTKSSHKIFSAEFRSRVAQRVCAVSIVDLKSSGPLLQVLGDTSHLPPDLVTLAHQGAKAYRKGRQRERGVILPDGTTHAGRTPAHWRRVALMAARMTGKRVGVGTATRMLEPGDE